MAAALRVTGGPVWALAGLGGFGERVTDLLAGLAPGPTVTVSPDDLPAAFAGGADVVLLALFRPAPALCESADALSHASGVPWLPVVAEHPEVRVGPWVVPGAGPCFACCRARRVQHDRDWAATRALHAAYDADGRLGPGGFLPHQARLAAALAAGAPGTWAPGTVVHASLYDPALDRARVLARHGCPRCGAPAAAPFPRPLLALPKETAHAGTD